MISAHRWESILTKWWDTPHKSGGSNRLGCDCVGLVAGATAEAQGRKVKVERVPKDSFFFRPATAKLGWTRLRELFPGRLISLPTTEEILPGDWLIGYYQESPAHLGIVVRVSGGTGIACHCSEASKKVTICPFKVANSSKDFLMKMDQFEVRKIYRTEQEHGYT